MAIPLTAREPVAFTPPSLPEKYKAADGEDPKLEILVRVPTMLERDSYAAALVRAGVASYTQRQIREIALGGVQELYDESEHDEIVALLQEMHTVVDAEAECEAAQQRRLLELHEKAKAAKKAIDPKKVIEELDEIVPSAQMDQKRRIRAMAINQHIMAEYEPMREALGSIVDQDAKRAWLNATTYVVGWKGLPHEPDGNKRGGLAKHETEYLRNEIGSEAFQELSDFITSLQSIDEDEEKNLASLLANVPRQNGSTQSTSTASSDDGNSTAGSSGKTRASASRKTTGSPSNSTKGASGKKAKSRRGRTGARSSTSP